MEGDVVIWDPVSGMRTLQFTAYANSTEWERTVDNAITAMCLDPTRRQLATGNAQVNSGVCQVRRFRKMWRNLLTSFTSRFVLGEFQQGD